jgi:transposase
MAVAYIAHEHGAEVTSLGTLGTRPCDRDHLIRTLPSQGTPLVCVSEAGPCGAWRSRDRTPTGQVGWVVAPSRIPTTAGDRLTTDRRAAVPRARLRRSGALTPVYVPTVEDEAIRHLRRAREEALRDLKSATCRRHAFLRRQEIRSTGRATWGPAPLRWLADVVWATPAHQIVCQADVRAVTAHTARLQRLEHARRDPVHTWRLQPVGEALPAVRGVQFTVAVPLVAELGDLTRCEQPRPLRNYLGLIPSTYARGERRRPGALTTAGHPHARRALVEGAWASRDPANVSRPLHLRLEQLPKPSQDLCGKAPGRRGQRSRRLLARGTPANQVVVAMARELAGVLWAMAQPVPVPLEGHQTERPWTHQAASGQHRLEAAQPRGGAPLDGVTSPTGTLGPRWRDVRWDPTHG